MKVAEKLGTCAYAHVHNIRVLETTGTDVTNLYRVAGYFRVAAEAYSSKAFVDGVFDKARAIYEAKMNEALASPPAERVTRAREFMASLHADLDDCATYQRANANAITNAVGASKILSR